MEDSVSQAVAAEQLDRLNEMMSKGISSDMRHMLNKLPAEDIAHLLESSPPKQRSLLWKLVDEDNEGDVLSELNDDIQRFFLESMNTAELVNILSGQDSDDLADMLQQLPDQIIHQVLARMSLRDRQRVEVVLSYPEDTAGGLMNTDTLSVHPDMSLEMVLRYFKQGHQLPEPLDHLYILEDDGLLLGVVPFSSLLKENVKCNMRNIMSREYTAIAFDTKQAEVAQLFERRDLVSAPVVNEKGILLGRITVDDVVDVIRDEAEHSLMSMAGLDENSDTFAGIWKTAKNRAVWLSINLMTAFISASVIGLFQNTIEKVVALAVLMPVVASMGGNAGYQAMTLVMRAYTQRQISQRNIRWLLSRELGVGLLNGCLWGSVVSAVAWWWFSSVTIAWIIAVAMLINLTSAVILGAALPVIMRRLNIDPALAGSVVLTTMTDAIGFFSFLGLSALFFM